MSKDYENGRIESVYVGFESHGIFTIYVSLKFNSAGQSFGGLSLKDEHHTRFIRKILSVFGVDELDKVRGQYARVVSEVGRIIAIGHIVEDRWFDINDFLASIHAEGNPS